MSDIEDLIIKEKPRCEANEQLKEGEASKKEDSKVYFIVMVESVENLTCYQFHMSDEVLTYYWVLDSISRAEILDTAAYTLPSSS